MGTVIHYQQCPVCGSPQMQPVFSVKDFTVSRKEFPIMECEHCSLRFTQDIPDMEDIGAYYKSDDYISHTNTSKGFVNSLYQKVRLRTIKQKVALIKKYTGLSTGNILDVGCGIGTFLHAMKQAHWHITGLEPDADARRLSKELYGLETRPSHELFAFPHHDFNAITMWHVLEHVHDLHAYVEQLKNLLTATGKLVIALPNYTSRDAQVYKQFWAAYDVPRHLYHFSPQSVDVLMQHHDLKVIKRLPMWYDSFYISLLSSKYKHGKQGTVSAGLHGVASNLNALGNVKECSSVIYIIEKC
jgi:SAM-dependent methyltransferase